MFKKCKKCGGERLVSFLIRYSEPNTKVFMSNCNKCGDQYIFFIKTDKDGNKKYSRTYT